MKTYTKKNGEVVTKNYDQKEYNKRHYERNKEAIINDTYICECCDTAVNTRNKTNHKKTLRHQLYHQLHENNKIINVGQ
jgi:hypothetical protein